LAYFLGVFLHGIWNTFGLLMGFAEYLQPVNHLNVILSRLGGIAPLALGVLTMILIAIILYAHKEIKPDQAVTATEGSNEIVINMHHENE